MADSGRPTAHTPELATQICQHIADGLSLRRIAELPGMPAKSTILKWAVEDVNGFSDQYEKARRIQAQALADEIFDIADDGSNDWVEKQDQNGPTGDSILNTEHVQRSRLRLDTRKWYLSKVLPKIYGDKQHVEHSGGITVDDNLTDEQRAERVAAILDRARTRRTGSTDEA